MRNQMRRLTKVDVKEERGQRQSGTCFMRLSSAISKDNIRRQVARKRDFEMAMPAGGTDAVEHQFEISEYVRQVYRAFKEGDDDTLYAMRGLLLLALQFRNGTRRVSQPYGECVHAHTHTVKNARK